VPPPTRPHTTDHDEVTMEPRELLADAFDRLHADVRRVAEGTDATTLVHRPDPGANSIAWLVWHATRIQDDHLAELAGHEQVWTADGWVERFGFDLPVEDTGFGHDASQVAAVRPEGPEPLVDYHAEVTARTRAYLDDLRADDLDRVIDEAYDPPVTVGIRLVSVMHDAMQHLGQAAYLRGMIERGKL
jgi:peptidoglycan/xylan/chitin deacetylase (PgdA/CDA1 family)